MRYIRTIYLEAVPNLSEIFMHILLIYRNKRSRIIISMLPPKGNPYFHVEM